MSDSSPAPSSSPVGQLSSALKYFLTLLRGQMVVAECADGQTYEGLFHTLEGDALVLHYAQKQPTAENVPPRQMPRMEIERNTTHTFQGVLKLPLADVIQVFASDLSLAQWTTAYADWMAQHAPKPSAAAVRTGGSGAGSAFATDSQISGASDKERELVRWDGAEGGGEVDLSMGGSGSTGGEFNQFETFERMTGKTSTFKFDEYSTPLDRSSAFYKSNEARAAAIASSIMQSEAGSAHQRLEREGDEDVTHMDRDADEGDLFSDVRREPQQPAATTGKYKPGAFAQAKKAAGSVGPAKSTTPVTSPHKDGKNGGTPKPAVNGAAANGETPSASPPASTTSPKPLEISLDAQKKVAELAASPKEPPQTKEASPAPAPAAASTASATTETKDASTGGEAAKDGEAPKKKSTLNAKAPAFKMSAAAQEFVPGGVSSAPTPVVQMPMQQPPLSLMVSGGGVGVGGMGQPFVSLPPQQPTGGGMPMFMPQNVGLLPGGFPMQTVPGAPLLSQQQQQQQQQQAFLLQQLAAGNRVGQQPGMPGGAPFFIPQQQAGPFNALALQQQQQQQQQLQLMMAAAMNPQFASGMPQQQFNPAAAAAMAQFQRQQQPNAGMPFQPNQLVQAQAQAFMQQQQQQQQQQQLQHQFRGGQQQFR